jgi:hypothetical protein
MSKPTKEYWKMKDIWEALYELVELMREIDAERVAKGEEPIIDWDNINNKG